MTPRQRIEAALSPEGTAQTPAVICYEQVFIRDHWEQLSPYPWWFEYSPDLEKQIQWRTAVLTALRQDWFRLPDFYPPAQRKSLEIEELDAATIVLKDRATGHSETIARPPIGGWKLEAADKGNAWDLEAITMDDLEPLLAVENTDPGGKDLAQALQQQTAGAYFPLRHIHSPLWDCYFLFGFQTLMLLIATRPQLIARVCARLVEKWKIEIQQSAFLGAAGIWIEECLLDHIHPETYHKINLPILRALTDEIRAAGMKSILYFCGDPKGRLTTLIDSGCDALGFEEGKKNFSINIAEMAARVKGRCALLGNLDAVAVLQNGTDAELQQEIRRQLKAARLNRDRFIMSTGSPVTPQTPLDRVQRYCTHVRQEIDCRL